MSDPRFIAAMDHSGGSTGGVLDIRNDSNNRMYFLWKKI